jgi:hypothetical protein
MKGFISHVSTSLFPFRKIGESRNAKNEVGLDRRRYLPGSLASKAARIIRLTVGGRLGQASISRAKSGSIGVSRAKEWAKGCGRVDVTAFPDSRLGAPTKGFESPWG